MRAGRRLSSAAASHARQGRGEGKGGGRGGRGAAPMKCWPVLGVRLVMVLSSCGGSVVKLTEGAVASSLAARRVTSISCRKTLAMACSTGFSKAIE